MKDYVGREDELIMPGSVVKGSLSVRVVIPKLGRMVMSLSGHQVMPMECSE